jgi:phage terminase large subunit-like protein
MAATATDGTREQPRMAADGDTYWKEDVQYIYRQEQAFDGEIHSAHPNKKLYRHWIETGEMELTHGTIVDYDVVAQYIFELSKRFTIDKIGYDDYKWQEFADKLARMGGSDELVAFGQTYGDFTPPTKSFELGVERGTILLAKNEVTKWCFGNAILDTDPRGNVKPMKKGQYMRIDGVITAIMACGLLFDVGHTRHNKNNFEK